MPIQSVNNQILELLYTSDKKVQDFINSLKPGDVLNGKIIDIFQKENKAIINFKGYNLISQLPQNLSIQKGDVINVVIYNIDNKVYMKLNNSISNSNNLQLNIVSNNSIMHNDILNILNSIKIPINEHNLLVVQNLIKYQLPINNENINTINDNFINYIKEKGIDYRIFNNKNLSVSKEIILSNMIKFNDDVNKINYIVNQNLLNDNVDLSKITERLSNLLKISIELNKNTIGQDINTDNDSLYINFKNITSKILDNILLIFEKQGFNIDKNLNLLTKLDTRVQLNNNVFLTFDNNSLSIKFENLLSNLRELYSVLNKNEYKQISKSLDNIISDLNNINFKKQNTNELNPELYKIKNILDEVNRIFFQPENLKLAENVKQIKLLLNSFKSELENIKTNNVISKNTYDKIFNSLDKTIKIISNINFENRILPNDFNNYQNNIKQFILDVKNYLNFKIFDSNNINAQIFPSNYIDIESILESIVFLKTRNIDISNEKFINIMSKYFSNNMKLSNNLEKLNIIINDFINIINKNDGDIKNTFNNLMNIINDIKNNINEISIKPNINNLTPDILLDQIKNFINKSGLNIESNIKNIISTTQQGTSIQNQDAFQLINKNTDLLSINILHNNLKSLIIQLNNEIDNINYNENQKIKNLMMSFKEISKDILDNLNAIQLINQKQSNIDMIYVQIPVFLETKYFNGELQVWYKKNSSKQDLGNLNPVNMLFILNTSNLGVVKINLIIFKNKIDCIIKTENEYSKQILNRNKNEFIKKLNELNYDINLFNIQIENGITENLNDNYINLTNINFRA